IKEILKTIDEVNTAEDAHYGDRDLEEVDPTPLDADAVERRAEELEERLNTQPEAPKQARRVVRDLRLKLVPRLRRYEQQLAACGDHHRLQRAPKPNRRGLLDSPFGTPAHAGGPIATDHRRRCRLWQ
ncbi:hypothetical protein HIJ39_23235, partial [Sulfobacillus sp. DSM 109850]|nr:hypothetical protein [Sulfobacillus harzensis]